MMRPTSLGMAHDLYRPARPPLTADLMLRAYAAGIFPMSEGAETQGIFWVDPQHRGVFPLDGFHVSRSLRKRMRQGKFKVTVNRDFAGVVAACADREETWINTEIESCYMTLHAEGYAHSVEAWQDGTLAGGIFGVALGSAFFGESMFSRQRDGSKIALTYLISRLRAGGFTLFDTQFTTEHLESLGARDMPRSAYREALQEALRRPADFFAEPLDVSSTRVLEQVQVA